VLKYWDKKKKKKGGGERDGGDHNPVYIAAKHIWKSTIYTINDLDWVV